MLMLLWALATLAASAQNFWTNSYNGPGNGEDRATAIAVDASGNVFVTGYSTNSGSGQDYATLKYSGVGLPLWTNRYSSLGNNTDQARAIAVDGNGNVLVTGSASSDYATIKYSNDGVPLWTNRFNGSRNESDQANAIAVDDSGNVFVTGQSASTTSSYEYATIKYSYDGVPLWTNRFNRSEGRAVAMAVDCNGNIIVTGYSTGGPTVQDYTTIKYSNDGMPLWTNYYTGPGSGADEAVAVAVDNSGNVFVTGNGVSNYSRDYVTIKYAYNGVSLWTNTYSGPGHSYDQAIGIAVDGAGNVFVAGRSIDEVVNYATIKYSNDGVPLWTNRYHAYSGRIPIDSITAAITVDAGGNVFVTGFPATVQYSDLGVPLWMGSVGGTATAIAADGSGNVFVAGYSGSGMSSDYLTIKYTAPLPPNAVLENLQLTTNEFSFNVTAEPGGIFLIQASIDFVNWSVIRAVTIPSSGSTNIVELFTPEPTQKLYRAWRLTW